MSVSIRVPVADPVLQMGVGGGGGGRGAGGHPDPEIRGAARRKKLNLFGPSGLILV